MYPPEDLQTVLAEFIARSPYSMNNLAHLSKVPKETIKNWLEGKSKQPNRWQDIVRVATVLALNLEDVDRLLRAARRETVSDLLHHHTAGKDEYLLVPWLIPFAKRSLIALASTILPDAGPLPPGSRMPLSRNSIFVGREADLLVLAAALSQRTAVAIGQIAAATGFGGIGKTQLAVEFVHRYGQFFAGGVFWLSFADVATVPTEVAACGGAGYLDLRPDFVSLSLNEQTELVRAAWQSPLPRLLIFDNCEDEALLRAWCPTSGGCHVIITSRRAEWDATLGVTPLPLDVFARPASIALLRKHRPDLPASDPTLDAIAAELGDLPLALHLAGSYLQRYRYVVTPTAYLAELRRAPPLDHQSLHSLDPSPTNHIQYIARTFALSYERLDPRLATDALALTALARIACFAPGEPISRHLIHATFASGDEYGGDSITIEDALRCLVELGLVTITDDGSVRMHRLVIVFVHSRSNDALAGRVVEQTLLSEAKRYNEVENVTSLLHIQAHLRFVTDMSLTYITSAAADLAIELGHHLWAIGNYQQAQPYLERALSLYERRPEPQSLSIAACYNLLGLVYQMQSQFRDAESFFTQALLHWEAHLPSDHLNIATEHNNLGYVLMTMCQFAPARDHYHQSLGLTRKAWGLYHAGTARIVNNLGYLLLLQGYYRQAGRYLKLALAIREQVLDGPYISTAQSYNNVGEILYLLGDLEAAWSFHVKSVTMRCALFGDDHHETAESYYNFGRILQAQGRHVEAHTYFVQALSINRKSFGLENFGTLLMQDSVGSVLCDLGQYVDAQTALDQALAASQSILGRSHWQTARILDNLGILYFAQECTVQAATYINQALTLREELLGADHPDTAQSLYHSGQLLCKQGHPVEAQSRFVRALAVFTRRLGTTHPRTDAVRLQLDMLRP